MGGDDLVRRLVLLQAARAAAPRANERRGAVDRLWRPDQRLAGGSRERPGARSRGVDLVPRRPAQNFAVTPSRYERPQVSKPASMSGRPRVEKLNSSRRL